MIGQTKPLSEVTQQALAVLIKEIGVVNTVRFLNQFTMGYGDYTAERDTLFSHLPPDPRPAAVKQRQSQPKGPPLSSRTAAPNYGMQATANSLRSCLAPAIGRGSPPAFGARRRGERRRCFWV